jgi:hypothetical protein
LQLAKILTNSTTVVFHICSMSGLVSGANRLQNVRSINGSWMPAGDAEAISLFAEKLDLGLDLFQLLVREIDTRVSANPADLIATLAYLSGRIVQRGFFKIEPNEFRLDQAGNGVVFFRNDAVGEKLGAMKSGSLASALVEASLLAGSRRFPEISLVRQDAQEAMQRHGNCDLRGHVLSAPLEEMAGGIQADIDALMMDDDDASQLTAASFSACAHAISYSRQRIAPADAAELAMSVAFYAGWIDARKSGTR